MIGYILSGRVQANFLALTEGTLNLQSNLCSSRKNEDI
jgi:hypothetical protein